MPERTLRTDNYIRARSIWAERSHPLFFGDRNKRWLDCARHDILILRTHYRFGRYISVLVP